jgi:hypothetical protein
MNEEITTKQWALNVVVAIVIVGAIGFGVYQTVKAPDTDDSAFRNEFVYACATEANITFCDCTYNNLKEIVGLDGLLELSVEYDRTGVMPKEGYTAVAKCADKY